MEALGLLIEMVKDLPDMALYLVMAYFAYKTLIIGSIYGLIRFIVAKIHAAYVTPRDQIIKDTVFYDTVAKMTLTKEGRDKLLTMLRGTVSSKYGHLYGADIDWIEEAIQEKKDREAKNG